MYVSLSLCYYIVWKGYQVSRLENKNYTRQKAEQNLGEMSLCLLHGFTSKMKVLCSRN